MRSEYQTLLTISSLVFIMMPLSEGIPATNSSKRSELDVFEPNQTGNETHVSRLRVSIGSYDPPVMNQMENFSCSSSEDVSLNLNTAGPSVFTHPVFTECRDLIVSITATSLTESTFEEYQNPFSNLPHLKDLTIHSLSISRLTKDFFAGLPELEHLSVRGSIPKVDPDAFTGMPNLRRLRLVYITVDGSHLESLKSLPNLEELKIELTSISNIDALKGLPKLKNLSLIHDSISKFNITELKENLPNLRSVDLCSNSLDPEFVKELEKDELFHFTYPLIPTYYQ